MDVCGTANPTICNRKQVHIGRNQLSDGSSYGSFTSSLLWDCCFGEVFKSSEYDFASFGSLHSIIACFTDVWNIAIHKWGGLCKYLIDSYNLLACGSYSL